MNIKFDVDMTPEELRRLMGLPDVQEFNRAIMDQMLKNFQEGMYDPMSFFKAGVMGNTEIFKNWMDSFGNLGGKSADK